jgi:hypothetical protein
LKKELNPAIALSVVAVVVLLAGYFLFMRSDTGTVSGEVAHTKSASGQAAPDDAAGSAATSGSGTTASGSASDSKGAKADK